jgi:hypothetical protein
MTPKEKAQQLRDKFYLHTTITELEEAKECALIVVNELIEECDKFFEAISKDRKQYWQKVKKELIEL